MAILTSLAMRAATACLTTRAIGALGTGRTVPTKHALKTIRALLASVGTGVCCGGRELTFQVF